LIKIAKTELTEKIEQAIYKETIGKSLGCFEVTLGWFGKRRVDYITMDFKDIFRCYEIKISKSDFHSEHGHNFVGHYNYYVMPKELFEEVKDEISKEIGVYGSYEYKDNMFLELLKKPKKQELKVEMDILKNSMIRSLSREVTKFYNTCDEKYINKLKKRINKLEKSYKESENRRMEIGNELFLIKDKLENPNDYLPKSRINRLKLQLQYKIKSDGESEDLKEVINELDIMLKQGGDYNGF
jgi:hypothetical protein